MPARTWTADFTPHDKSQAELSRHARISVIKHATGEYFATEDGRGDLAGIFSIIDPQSGLDLVEIAETRITAEEVQALHQVNAVLFGCIQRTATDPAAIEFTRHAEMVGSTTK